MASHGDLSSITLPIQSKSLAFSRSVSQLQGHVDIAQRVFQNAIAVTTVQGFLEILGTPSRYDHSDLCNPVVQLAADLSDLEIPNVGSLECRWLDLNNPDICVPYEAWGDRVGYAFVSFDLQAREATIQGFLPAVTAEQISRCELRSVEFMIQHLDALTQAPAPTAESRLTHWLAGNCDPAWETTDSTSETSSPPLTNSAFRGGVAPSVAPSPRTDVTYGATARRAKPLQWQPQSDQSCEPEPEPVMLVVEINQAAPLVARVTVQIQPTSATPVLPSEIEFLLFDESGQMLTQAIAQTVDNCRQLSFRGEPGDLFQVRLRLGHYQILENVQI